MDNFRDNIEKLIPELRNKLSPIKNYLSMQRELESLASKKGDFIDGIKQGKLTVLIEKEKLKAEDAMSKVEMILELMENQ
jgi:hypothetical protein